MCILIDRTVAKDRVCAAISCIYIRTCPKYAFGTTPSKAYVSGARLISVYKFWSIVSWIQNIHLEGYPVYSIPHVMRVTHRILMPINKQGLTK